MTIWRLLFLLHRTLGQVNQKLLTGQAVPVKGLRLEQQLMAELASRGVWQSDEEQLEWEQRVRQTIERTDG